jgi:IMP dehydrogenase
MRAPRGVVDRASAPIPRPISGAYTGIEPAGNASPRDVGDAASRHAGRPSLTKRSRLMTTVAQVLKSKPEQTVYTILAEDSVYNAIKLMAEKQIGALVVKDGDAIAGIITERDYARKVVLMDRSSKVTPVREIMSPHVRFVRLDQTTDECMALMTERRMRHLPVIDQEKLVGMVSIGDLVKNIIAEQQFTIEQLEHYITGGKV